jgi:hypothetical protein
MTTADAKEPGSGPVGDEPLDEKPDQGAEPWDDAPLETEQLAFDEKDVRLPWLEADGDDDEDFERGGTGQLATLIVIGLLAILVIGGGVWWAVENRRDEVLVADGSVIAAPEQPYKERPADPGGKTFAGTGDTSFAVSGGQTRPARLGETAPPKTALATPATPASPAAPAPTGVGVQVAAYTSRASAEAGWTKLSAQYEALAGLDHRIVEGTADIGTVYRLQVLAADVSSAHALCGRLKAAGLACQVKN